MSKFRWITFIFSLFLILNLFLAACSEDSLANSAVTPFVTPTRVASSNQMVVSEPTVPAKATVANTVVTKAIPSTVVPGVVRVLPTATPTQATIRTVPSQPLLNRPTEIPYVANPRQVPVAQLPKYNGLPVLPRTPTVTAASFEASIVRRANYGLNGQPKVGLQAGHFEAVSQPEELADLRYNSGAAVSGFREVDFNMATVRRVAVLLQSQGIEVDIIPATVPIAYTADLFVAFHADGDTTGVYRGFKIARSRFSLIPKTDDALVDTLNASYGAATGLPRDDERISRNMLGYYAFNNRRFQHSITSFTPAAIVEMGYVTNAVDRNYFITHADQVAQGVANGIVTFLANRPPFEQREKSTAKPVIEALSEYTTLYSSTTGEKAVAYLTRGHQLDSYEIRDNYYRFFLYGLNQLVFAKRSEFK